MNLRQIVLDTETTGLETAAGHRVIEIGAVEIVNRRLSGRHFHEYINPGRAVDPAAFEVHGISDDFLADKPVFETVVERFVEFIKDAELVIHNAPFDVGFLDHELGLSGRGERLRDLCSVCDTLQLARARHPGKSNTLDALCKRYGVDNSQRERHGALLDAEILAEVYLAMTGGQVGLSLASESATATPGDPGGPRPLPAGRPRLPVIEADAEELAAHRDYLQMLQRGAGRALWPQA